MLYLPHEQDVILRHVLGTALLLGCLTSQEPGPTPFTVIDGSGTTSWPTTIFGYGETSGRLLLRASSGAIGYIDTNLPTPAFETLLVSFNAANVTSAVWENGTAAPDNYYFVSRVTTSPPGQPLTIEHTFNEGFLGTSGQSLGVSTLAVLPLSPTETWVVDAAGADNNTFFLRRTSGGTPGSLNVGLATRVATAPSQPPAATFSMLASTRATGPIVTIRSPSSVLTTRYAYPTTAPGGQPEVMVRDLVGGFTNTIPVPAGILIESMHWITTRFLVARVTSTSFPIRSRIVRIDATGPAGPTQWLDLTPPEVNVRTLRVSGNRQWLTFQMEQTINGTLPESSVGLMRASDSVATQVGGGYVVLIPGQVWTFAGAPPVVQQSNDPLNPTVVFGARAPGSTLVSFHRATATRDISIVGRQSAQAGVSLTIQASDPAAGTFWMAGVAVSRSTIPGVLLDNPLLLGPFPIAPGGQSQTLAPIPPQPAALNARLFFQAGWFDLTGAIAAGRVTELPIF